MAGKNKWTRLAYAQAATHINPCPLKHIHFIQQSLRRNNYSVSYITRYLGPQDSGGNKMQHGLPATNNQSVASVMTPLETYYPLGVIR
jgi:hypothetical protein